MARSNKYAAINFNEIYGPKKPSPSPSTQPSHSSQNTPLSQPRSHGRMLILTRPSKPQALPTTTPPPPPPKPADLPRPEPDSISLRPLGRTEPLSSSTSTIQIKEEKQSPPLSFRKPEPFVPPHLRPGFVGHEEKLGLDLQREKQGFRPRDRNHTFVQGHVRGGGEDGRPRSGGGYEGMQQRGGGSDLEKNRPSSSGNRPSSSG